MYFYILYIYDEARSQSGRKGVQQKGAVLLQNLFNHSYCDRKRLLGIWEKHSFFT